MRPTSVYRTLDDLRNQPFLTGCEFTQDDFNRVNQQLKLIAVDQNLKLSIQRSLRDLQRPSRSATVYAIDV